MNSTPNLDVRAGRRLLFRVTDMLERYGIPYHLEGGTLLGIVRDGDLLAWDHDLDISIPAEYIRGFDFWKRLILRMKLYRVTARRFTADSADHGWAKGDFRIFRVCCRAKGVGLLQSLKSVTQNGWPRLDIFVKYRFNGKVWWAAKSRVMAVDDSHYSSYETVEYFGRKLRVPVDYKEYLTRKYGDWSLPVKVWNCQSDEGTIRGFLKK
jgi:hypothetical protein